MGYTTTSTYVIVHVPLCCLDMLGSQLEVKSLLVTCVWYSTCSCICCLYMLGSQLQVKSLLVTCVWYSTMSAVDCCYRVLPDRVANGNTCDLLIDSISEYMDCQVAVYLYYSLSTWNRKLCAIILYMYVAPNHQLAWFETGLKWLVSSQLTLG